jgi:hypothetical protein
LALRACRRLSSCKPTYERVQEKRGQSQGVAVPVAKQGTHGKQRSHARVCCPLSMLPAVNAARCRRCQLPMLPAVNAAPVKGPRFNLAAVLPLSWARQRSVRQMRHQEAGKRDAGGQCRAGLHRLCPFGEADSRRARTGWGPNRPVQGCCRGACQREAPRGRPRTSLQAQGFCKKKAAVVQLLLACQVGADSPSTLSPKKTASVITIAKTMKAKNAETPCGCAARESGLGQGWARWAMQPAQLLSIAQPHCTADRRWQQRGP